MGNSLLRNYGKFPTDMISPPLQIRSPIESNPLKFRILVRRLAVPLPLPLLAASVVTTNQREDVARRDRRGATDSSEKYILIIIIRRIIITTTNNDKHNSGGRLCTLIGVPWRGSVLAPSARGGVLKQYICKGAESAEHAETAGYTYEGTPTTA